MDLPRQRKQTNRYGKQDAVVNMSDLDTSNSDTEQEDDVTGGGVGSGNRSGKRRNKKGRGHTRGGGGNGTGDDVSVTPLIAVCDVGYNRTDCFKVEKSLLVYG